MDGRHWTEDEFLNRLYEAGGGDESHLANCAQCAARWGELRASRAAVLRAEEPEFSHEMLAAQRRAIYRRLESGPSRRLPWVPALAAVAMVVVGLFFFRTGQEPVQPLGSPGDDKVFAEIYAMEQSAEPAAAAKLKGLFEEEPL